MTDETPQVNPDQLAADVWKALEKADAYTAVNALFEVMTWMMSSVEKGDDVDAVHDYHEYIHENFHSAFDYAQKYADLALIHDHEDIKYDTDLGEWVTNTQQVFNDADKVVSTRLN